MLILKENIGSLERNVKEGQIPQAFKFVSPATLQETAGGSCQIEFIFRPEFIGIPLGLFAQ